VFARSLTERSVSERATRGSHACASPTRGFLGTTPFRQADLGASTSLHRDRRARLDGGGLRRLVGAIFRRELVEKSATLEPSKRAITHAADDRFELGDRRRRRRPVTARA
jgi:hypothetical protein